MDHRKIMPSSEPNLEQILTEIEAPNFYHFVEHRSSNYLDLDRLLSTHFTDGLIALSVR